MEDSFSTDLEVGDIFGMIQVHYIFVHLIGIIITSLHLGSSGIRSRRLGTLGLEPWCLGASPHPSSCIPQKSGGNGPHLPWHHQPVHRALRHGGLLRYRADQWGQDLPPQGQLGGGAAAVDHRPGAGQGQGCPHDEQPVR